MTCHPASQAVRPVPQLPDSPGRQSHTTSGQCRSGEVISDLFAVVEIRKKYCSFRRVWIDAFQYGFLLSVSTVKIMLVLLLYTKKKYIDIYLITLPDLTNWLVLAFVCTFIQLCGDSPLNYCIG